MMAPWDSKMRWQLGGNLQRVRLICEHNWRECPFAIANHIWSEIVTDVVDCITNEAILLRLIILILVCTILFHTIWTRAQWITGSIVSKDNLNRMNFKLQDLELRVNVLTYKIQYGAWPSPQQINDTNIKELKDDVRLSLPSSNSHRYSWWDQCLDCVNFNDHHISRSENLELHLRKPKTLNETSQKIYYNRPNEMRELQLFDDALDTHKQIKKYHKMEKRPKKYIEAITNKEKCYLTKGIRESTKRYRMRQSIIKKSEEKRRKSKRAHLSLRSIHDYIPITTTAESSCEDSGNLLSTLPNKTSKLKINSALSAMKTLSTMDSSASFKRINSTQKTLTNIKERLENLHIILKNYGSHHDLESTKRDDVKEELIKNSLQNLSELYTETEKNYEEFNDNITSKLTETTNVHNQQTHKESVCMENDENKKIDPTKDKESNFKVEKKDEKIKSSTLNGTDEDLDSFSNPLDPSKVGSDSDKSTQSSDALMLNALLNQLDLTNLRQWNNKSTLESTEDESECETENIFPKMKNIYQSKLLDIISEEQSGNSSTERASQTIVHSEIMSKKTDSTSECSNELQREELSNVNESCEITEENIIEKKNDVELQHPDFNIENNSENPGMYEETKDNMNDLAFKYDRNTSELSNISPQTESATMLNTVKSIRPWEKLLKYSSEKSLGNCVSNSENYHWNPEVENISKSCEFELDHLLDIQNDEQLMDIANLTLKRRSGVFSMTNSTNISEYDNQLIQNLDNDLIDLNYDDNDNAPKNGEMTLNYETDILMTLIDATNILNTTNIDYLGKTVSSTSQTVINTDKIEDNINSQITDNDEDRGNHKDNDICSESLCKNSNSRNLIELERITYEELTQVENSWDSECIFNNNREEVSISEAETDKNGGKKLRSHSKKSPLNILSSPSSVYLTVHGSFSDMSVDSNHCTESIDKIKMPDEIKNIENVEENHAYCDRRNKSGHDMIIKSEKERKNEDVERTVISKDSAFNETPQQSIIIEDNTDTNGKFINAEVSSINSNTGTSCYVEADSHNLTHSNGVSSSYESQSLDGHMKHSSSLSNKAEVETTADPIKTAKKLVTKKVNSRNSKTTKLNDKKQILSAKTKSNSNLSKEIPSKLQTQKSNNYTDQFGQRRSKSYIIPRKHDVVQVHQDSSKVRQHNSITKFNNAETNIMNSKSSLIDRLSSSKTKIECTNSFSKSRESVNKTTSKSCIPILKTRFDTTKNLDSLSRSQLQGPLTMSIDDGRNSMEMREIEKIIYIDKNDKNNNKTHVYRETIDDAKDKHPVIAPERQTVIYVNIATDHDNCVTKVVDPKKFLEYVKNKNLNIQNIINDNNYSHNQDENHGKECTNPKFVTVVSSTEKSPLLFYSQREIEVLAKPSVINMSTSISDIPKENNQPKELTTNEYIALLKSLEQSTNIDEYQKIHQACNELKNDAQE